MSIFPNESPRKARAAISLARVCLLGALCLILFCSFDITLAAGIEPLGLNDAVNLAEHEVPMIQAREAAVESAQSAVVPAGQLPDPQLTFGIDSLPVTTAEAFSLTRDSFTERTIGVMQQFPRREKRRLRTERAQASEARELALLTSERLSVRESVARAWIACSTAERRLQLLQALQPRAQAAVAAATAALSSGRGSAADGIATKSAQAMLADRISQVEREVDEARAEFARWLPDAAERPLGDAPDWSDLGIDPESIVAHAGRHRELLAYDAAEHVADTEVALARADKRPDWSVELAYAQRGPQYSNFVSLQLRVDLPIFPKSRQDPVIVSKLAALTQIQAEREDALRMHTAQLHKTLAAWRSANERVQRYEHELLPLADDRVAVALAAYGGGRGDMQAWLSALDVAIEQRITYTQLQTTLGQAWAALHFAFPQER